MKKILGLALVMLMVFSLVIPVSASTTVAVIKAEFPVIVNGRVVENNVREYPFILCNSITYFPMTYEDCAFLGIENNWTASEGNVITKSTPSGYYKDFIDPELSYRKKGETATVVTTPVTVLGERINNAAEAYPILNYKNVLYFPLTWDWGQKFGWNISFSEDKILEVTTEGFEDAGYFYSYSKKEDEIIQEKHKIADNYADSILYGSYASDYSPNYAFYVKNDGGFVTLFRLLPMRDEERIISVKEELVPQFLAKGWHKVEEARDSVFEFIKTHSMGEFRTATENLRYGRLSEAFSSVCEEIESNYTTLYYGDNTCRTVRNEEIYAYTSAGWMKADDYAIDAVNYCESRKDYGMALTLIEKNMGYIYADMPDHPYPDFSDLDYSLGDELYKGLCERYASYLRGGVVLREAILSSDDFLLIFDCVLPKGMHLIGFDMSYDLVDATGAVIEHVSDGVNVFAADFNADKTIVKSTQHYISIEEKPYVVGIKNVKITNPRYDDLYNLPMGMG